jgi:hypothetical protein
MLMFSAAVAIRSEVVAVASASRSMLSLGDRSPANHMYPCTQRITLLDCGCVRLSLVTPPQQQALLCWLMWHFCNCHGVNLLGFMG